jgi:hypothetical protein
MKEQTEGSSSLFFSVRFFSQFAFFLARMRLQE